ncbi:MAG: MgtC/SapB family protein [Bacteroidetes bacterium]|nr:MgtC/SapB family protein [Bacteroidota bacterium]
MNSFEWTFELRFIIALALGFLIGLERESAGVERKGKFFAGVRTYTLISLFGFGCAWLYHLTATFAIAVGLLVVGALVLVEYNAKQKEGRFGGTSEIAALLTYIIGALALLADVWISMAIGIISTLLLSEKAEIEKYVEKLNKSEFLAVIKFLLVTLIILPALPDKDYTQFNLNPTHIWQIVIMVSSIGFVGYFLMKRFGNKVGLWVSGILGGMVSSTAVSIAVGRIAKKDSAQSGNALQASILASSVMYIRILIIIWIINQSIISVLWWKLLLLSSIGIILSFMVKSKGPQSSENSVSTLQNPFEIKPAIIFAALFVLLSAMTILVKNFLGDIGLLFLSTIVGVTDIDPFILSLVSRFQPIETIVVSAIIISMMSNTLIKAIYFAFQAKQEQKKTFILYGIWTLLHIPFIFF